MNGCIHIVGAVSSLILELGDEARVHKIFLIANQKLNSKEFFSYFVLKMHFAKVSENDDKGMSEVWAIFLFLFNNLCHLTKYWWQK